jgi:hypothetical protein
MSAAHTPGPWQWHPCFDPTGKRITSLDVCPPKAHSLTGVAVLASVWGNEGNASRIAAAPELYEALLPFGSFDPEEIDGAPDDMSVERALYEGSQPTIGDLRRAAAILAKVRGAA